MVALQALPTLSLQLAPLQLAQPPRFRPPLLRAGSWTGQSEAQIQIDEIPIETLYTAYADLSRMCEWSPLLESVTVDAVDPRQSVWVMRIPKPLKMAAQALGYPGDVTWEATLDAPGPPLMAWTSRLDGTPGVANAGFIPCGSCAFVDAGNSRTNMTLTLEYTMPAPADGWKIAMVDNPVVQGIVRGRMVAGMKRFAAAVRRETIGA